MSVSCPSWCGDKKQALHNCHFTFSTTIFIRFNVHRPPISWRGKECVLTHIKKKKKVRVRKKHTHTHTHPASAAIKAINQPWLEAKIESCSDGYICYIPSSICLAALDNAAGFGVQTHCNNHSHSTGKAWNDSQGRLGSLLFALQGSSSLKALQCTNNAEVRRHLICPFGCFALLQVESW